MLFRSTEEVFINEFNSIEQIYIRFQAPFGLDKKVIFRANCLFSGQIFPPPQYNAFPYAYEHNCILGMSLLLIKRMNKNEGTERNILPTDYCFYFLSRATINSHTVGGRQPMLLKHSVKILHGFEIFRFLGMCANLKLTLG